MKHLLWALLPTLFSLAVAGCLFGGVVAYALSSPTFRLEEVRILNIGTITPDQAFKFCELQKGENLITLDLVGVQQVIRRKHPEFKEVRVRRVLPNRVEVLLKRRTPIAQVAFARYVQIDKDLVILPGSSPTPFRNLTVIEGAPPPREGLTVGVSIRDGATKKAIKLADLITRSHILRQHTLTKVVLSDPKNIAFFVDGDIEIKIGDSHFVERLKILDQTLKNVELDRMKIRYIDLRFDDVVIGPR
ncbi:MAG: cell division protein FtsQ/DivIB [Candidatus Omnitrophota bacterium]